MARTSFSEWVRVVGSAWSVLVTCSSLLYLPVGRENSARLFVHGPEPSALPAKVIVVSVETVYTQCPKALIRSHLLAYPQIGAGTRPGDVPAPACGRARRLPPC